MSTKQKQNQDELLQYYKRIIDEQFKLIQYLYETRDLKSEFN